MKIILGKIDVNMKNDTSVKQSGFSNQDHMNKTENTMTSKRKKLKNFLLREGIHNTCTKEYDSNHSIYPNCN
jgi:hypothetical protein